MSLETKTLKQSESESCGVPIPNDNYWKETTYKNYNKSSLEYEDFLKTLDPIDSKTLEIIENINGVVSFGVNFSSKIIGFDELAKCYIAETHPINSKSKKKDTNIVSIDRSWNQFFGKPVLGIRSFTRFPGGVIEYHKSNKKLFNTSTISLMLNKASFPLHFIEEFTDEKKLFKIKRSDGREQFASLCGNSSLFWSESKSLNLGPKWRIQVCFVDLSDMSKEEVRESYKNLSASGTGEFVKTVFLSDILKLNNLDSITLELTKLKMSLRETHTNEEFQERYGMNSDSDSYDSDCEYDNGLVEVDDICANSSGQMFIDRDKQPDVILTNYQNVINEGVTDYFKQRLDEYIISVKNSLSSEGIKVFVK